MKLSVQTLVGTRALPRPQPEPASCKARPAVSLFQSLPADQKAAILSYDGPQDHGDPQYRRA